MFESETECAVIARGRGKGNLVLITYWGQIWSRLINLLLEVHLLKITFVKLENQFHKSMTLENG